MSNLCTVACASALAFSFAGSALGGPDWLEQGDAGSTLNTAQYTLGVGQLDTIAGDLSAGFGQPDYEDMYVFSVTDPGAFSISVVANFNANLWIFNITLANEAFGLLGTQSKALGPFSDDGSGAALTQPGIYAIAISGQGRVPVSNMGEIFSFADPSEISGPDGPGGINPHNGWAGVGEVGSYVIHLQGSGFADVPAPGGIALLALLAACGKRRRRQ